MPPPSGGGCRRSEIGGGGVSPGIGTPEKLAGRRCLSAPVFAELEIEGVEVSTCCLNVYSREGREIDSMYVCCFVKMTEK
ncbi:hypothetical protein HanXRQr2_Chr10g0460061 [Helianthus annuus]|uniref:Uncharacterized protein n=1 Tax=Helianthus annuus TaxID=4232 RepID=A0A9K3I0U9_HELAN|nr:hypothetical protein HanXRQr2_Chr10g0460061 [Helianthus annuus]KAJ0885337.1 hypothetical protein HanPSC8_Chr10g0444151 [Helianthus annuus]